MKGIIADIKDNKAVLLNENSEFIYIANKNYTIGQQIEYKQNNYKQFYYMAASIILFMVISFTGYAQYYTPVSYMSIDINPSIQLEINRFSRVIKALPLNDDAERLLEVVKVQNKDLNQSIDRIIEESKAMGYLSQENNHVEIDIVTPKDKLMDDISSNVNKYEEAGISVDVEKSDENELNLARELGISVGRTKAISEYTHIFGGDTKENADKLSDFSVGDIKKTIKEKRNIVPDIPVYQSKETNDNNKDIDSNKAPKPNEKNMKENEKDKNYKSLDVKQNTGNIDTGELKSNTAQFNKDNKENKETGRTKEEIRGNENADQDKQENEKIEDENKDKNKEQDNGKEENNDKEVQEDRNKLEKAKDEKDVPRQNNSNFKEKPDDEKPDNKPDKSTERTNKENKNESKNSNRKK